MHPEFDEFVAGLSEVQRTDLGQVIGDELFIQLQPLLSQHGMPTACKVGHPWRGASPWQAVRHA